MSLHYFNYRLAFLRKNQQFLENVREKPFSKEYYNPREKIYFDSDPNHLANSIALKGNQMKHYNQWKEKFTNLKNTLNPETSLTLLLVPHCSQVSKKYQQRMEKIGAQFSDDLQQIDYPLIN